MDAQKIKFIPHKADMMYVDVTEEAKEEKKKGKYIYDSNRN